MKLTKSKLKEIVKEVVSEAVDAKKATEIRKKLLKRFGKDPLYKDFIVARTPKEQKKALDTLKSIRGSNAISLMQKYAASLQKESINEGVLYEAKYKQTYKSITARDKDSRRIWGSQIGHPRVSVRSWSEVGKTGRMKTAYIEIEGDKDWVDAYKKIAFSGKGNFTDVVKSLKESINEATKEKVYVLNDMLWLSYSPGSGQTSRITGRGYLTDKRGDKNYDSTVPKFVKWANSNKPVKKTKTQKLFKIPRYDRYDTDAAQYDIWGGDVKPKKYLYMLVASGKINVIAVFYSKAEAMSWVGHTNESINESYRQGDKFELGKDLDYGDEIIHAGDYELVRSKGPQQYQLKDIHSGQQYMVYKKDFEKYTKKKQFIQIKESKKISKKDYIGMAKDFVGQHKDSIIRYVKQDGWIDLQQMTVDTANALRYDPEYKNVDADWLYDAIEKELKKQSWWKRLGVRI